VALIARSGSGALFAGARRGALLAARGSLENARDFG
jgi:hypothetical protein